jgi:RNase P subunit RPR2
MSDSKTPPTILPPTDGSALTCPNCGTTLDPRKTTQALRRNSRLLLFCSSGCVRQYMSNEAASDK